jgi:hypothetical protein
LSSSPRNLGEETKLSSDPLAPGAGQDDEWNRIGNMVFIDGGLTFPNTANAMRSDRQRARRPIRDDKLFSNRSEVVYRHRSYGLGHGYRSSAALTLASGLVALSDCSLDLI